MRITVCISGWQDTELLEGAVQSIPPEWSVAYADGAYSTYLEEGQEWRTPYRDIKRALQSRTVTLLVEPLKEEPWESEAAKKTRLVQAAHRSQLRPHWLMILDTDERFEGSRLEVEKLLDDPSLDWATVECHRLDQKWQSRQADLPRFLRAAPDLRFQGPRDFEAYRGDRRIAYLDGEAMPEAECSWLKLPREVCWIRHEKRLRTVERQHQTGRYCQRRRALHG